MVSSVSSMLQRYQHSFETKIYTDENNETDILMDVFGITQELKQENKQYWGRELGSIWESLTNDIFKENNKEWREPLSDEFKKDKPVDYFLGNIAVDAKYRIGSGDAGTLKKFKYYGKQLRKLGYTPVFLILRTDNLQAAITAAKSGGWDVYVGVDALDFIRNHTDNKTDMNELLSSFGDEYKINR